MKGLIFTYGMMFGGAFAGLFSPYHGLLVYIAFAVLRPHALWHWSVDPGSYSRIVAVAMLIGWAAHGFGNWNFGRAKGVVWAFLGFYGWAVLSTVLAAENKSLALEFLELNAKILLPFLVGVTTIDSVDKLKKLAWILVLCQGFVAYEMNYSYYVLGWNRIYWNGFTGDNNATAIAMVTIIGLGFFLGLRAPKWWQKGVAGLCVLFMVNAIMLSYSRGGMLGLVITGCIAFFLVPKRPLYYVIFALAIASSLYLAGEGTRERFVTVFVDEEERDASAQSRLEMWRDCWDVMQRYPVLGCGPQNWREICVEYGWRRGKYAHSLWMQNGAELGFPGLAFLLLFYGLCMWRLWPLTREKFLLPDPWLHDVGRMVIASLVGFMVSAQFVSLWQLELPYYVVLLGAAGLKLASTLPIEVETDAAAEGAPATAEAWQRSSTVSSY